MHQRCPSKPNHLNQASLKGYKIIINNRGTANIIEEPNSIVYGIIYRITKEDIEQLDVHEGVKKNIYQKEFLQTIEGDLVLVYIDRNNVQEGTPRQEYKERMNRAIREASKLLPGDYLDEMRRLLA
jgi:gamma-glutamylcyclotransferase (GGCT)/AIG2-like uncharacterized protein YtfP